MVKKLVFETQEFAKEIATWGNFEQDFNLAKNIVKKLGVHYNNGKTTFLYWNSTVHEKNINTIDLNIYRSKSVIDFSIEKQNCEFKVFSEKLEQKNGFIFGVFEGIIAGNENIVGDFYEVSYLSLRNNKKIINDLMAYSIPFGSFPPAEVFDIQSVTKNRKDINYLKSLKGEVQKPSNVLEVHIPTSTKEGTIQHLGNLIEEIDQKIEKQIHLDNFEKAFLGYDAIELMPLQALVEHENGAGFWKEIARHNETINVQLTKPNTQNWGYDILISGSNAINPNLLATKRPSELVHFIEKMHNLQTKPMQVYLDVVYGHADSQGAKLLDKKFIAGDGMYGKVLNYKHLLFRAALLETMRRMLFYGIDGFRIDASQDINNLNQANNQLEYDADFLLEMDKIQAEVGEITYKPFLIFEDGRPWPEKGWALKQTYREVTELLPHFIQWSPLTFADNNPHIFNFWQTKFHRIKEVAEYGEHWLTGSSNHDSLRKGATQNPYQQPINQFFDEKISQIFHKGYNAPATKLLESFLPGTPMDFLHANVHAPWMFMRNTDEQWGLKIISEESNFFHWFITEEKFNQKNHFKRLKINGLNNYALLKNLVLDLESIVKISEYDWNTMLKLLQFQASKRYPNFSDVQALKDFSKNYLEDVHDFCNISHKKEEISYFINADLFFNFREFRERNHWLSKNLLKDDVVEIIPKFGAILYHICRKNVQTGETWAFFGNMEGDSINFDLPYFKSIVIQTNGIVLDKQNVTLKNSEAIVINI